MNWPVSLHIFIYVHAFFQQRFCGLIRQKSVSIKAFGNIHIFTVSKSYSSFLFVFFETIAVNFPTLNFVVWNPTWPLHHFTVTLMPSHFAIIQSYLKSRRQSSALQSSGSHTNHFVRLPFNSHFINMQKPAQNLRLCIKRAATLSIFLIIETVVICFCFNSFGSVLFRRHTWNRFLWTDMFSTKSWNLIKTKRIEEAFLLSREPFSGGSAQTDMLYGQQKYHKNDFEKFKLCLKTASNTWRRKKKC